MVNVQTGHFFNVNRVFAYLHFKTNETERFDVHIRQKQTNGGCMPQYEPPTPPPLADLS